MRRLLSSLGNPEQNFESVVIAGTNGKGSVSAFLCGILNAHGRRVGLYTSPHVYSVNERIAIDGKRVPIEVLEEAASRIVPLYEAIGYSYFEALTAIAFLVFAESGIKLAVLETGLGGRFDATNVVVPKVSVLTGISLDHRRILGDSEEEILREKLGITRPGVPLFCGRLLPELETIVRSRSLRDGIPLHVVGETGSVELRHMSFHGMRARIRTERGDYGEIPLPFLGEHQLGNALLSVRVAESLLADVDRLESAAGLVRLPGRFEVVRLGNKTVVLDVAHNNEALTATARTLRALSPREENAMILGILRRKEFRDFPMEIPSTVNSVYLVEPVIGESHTAGQLLEKIGPKNWKNKTLNVYLERNLVNDDDWMTYAERLASSTSPFRALLVTGSHRTVEILGRHFHRLESG
ncbi:MAG: hypothetical protein JSW58_02775 [Candidatus Latescibacterota bacterium]|nr:MAG: hypothetical protein JSW58_02775 [Candidatus Latescibacterota bacterium]